jgi:hypothetical protein
MISKQFLIIDDSQQKRKSILKAKAFILIAAGLPLILFFFTACGGGGIDTDFTVNSDGFDFRAAGPKYFADETYSRELPLAGHIRIRLEAVNGNIEIEGHDDVDTVTVVGQKLVGSDSVQDAKRQLNELEILVTENNDEIIVQTLQPRDKQGRQYIIEYFISIPSDFEAVVILDNGDVDVQDVHNSIMVSAVNGSINSSTILFSDHEIRLFTENGNVDLSIPTSTSAIFAAYVDNGSIATSNLEFDTSEQTWNSLTGTLGDGEGIIELDTVNGNIRVVGFN